jgi:integrase
MVIVAELRAGRSLDRLNEQTGSGASAARQATTAKSGQTRRVPLNREAVEVLAAWREQTNVADQPRVFPGVDGERLTTINTAWRSLRTAAGLPDFRFHDLRHHFASRLVQSGIDLNTVRELLGHADITMVLRYAHMSPDRLSMAVERVARKTPKSRSQTKTARSHRHPSQRPKARLGRLVGADTAS